MDATEQDGSGRPEQESWSPDGPAVLYNRWRPSGNAFTAYLRPILGRQPNQNGMVHTLRIVVDRPIVVKLTKDIIETYKNCNPNVTYSAASNPKRYLTNPSVPALNKGLDNENSDLILAVNGELVNEQANHRYIVKDLLGQGTFGQVAKCWADEKESFVAVKIIKNQPAYYQQALVEITILNMLNDKYDPEDKLHIVRILEHFVCQEHLCIVFEMLSVNLFELLKVNQFKGISLNLIRIFSKQILTALAVLREASVIHCDLKPENILLTTRPAAAELKLIDFGSACREYQTVYSYIQSRFYRSPEVVLGHKYTTAIDMWSCGCVAAELFLGLPLFPGQSQYDLLQRMIQILGGQPPDHILRNAKNTNKYFKYVGAPSRHNDGEGQHSAYHFLSLPEYEQREGEKPAIGKHYSFGNLEQRITNYHMKTRMSQEEMEKERSRRFVFVDFLKGLLNFDPYKRWTPWQAAHHPFITEEPFLGLFQPPPEAPRTPIRHGLTIDHNPVSGHWFGAGLSPRVNSTAVFQYGSPQYPGPAFSYASSYGSAGSYGSFGDGGLGLGNSFGSYGDAIGSYNHQLLSAKGNPSFGAGPDNWRRINHVPHSALGHAPLGLSPSSGSFMPLSLGTSPSNFTPPSSHFQPSPGSPSTGSPSRYGPTSPARSGGGAAALSKAAAFGQYNKRRGWGSPGSTANTIGGSRVLVQDNSIIPWLAHQNSCTGNDETSPFYVENTVQSVLSSSPGNASLQGYHHAAQSRHRNDMALGLNSGLNSGQVQNSKSSSYPTGSLGALMSKSQPTLDSGDDTSPPPNPGDWDPNYSEELLLQNDGGENASTSISAVTSLPGPTGVGGIPGQIAPGVGLFPSDNSERFKHEIHVQGAPQTTHFRSSGGMPYFLESSSQSLQGYGWNANKYPHYGHHPQQISPSRLGQTTQILQQQSQHQYHPAILPPSEHTPISNSLTQQRVHHQFYGQSMQLPEQAFPFQTSGHNAMLNGETGIHAALRSPKRDVRADHPQVMPSGGNFGRQNGFDIYMGGGYPVFFDGYDPSGGLQTLDLSNFNPQSESRWVSGFPVQRPTTNPNDWYNRTDGRFGNLNGTLLPPPNRKDRRDL